MPARSSANGPAGLTRTGIRLFSRRRLAHVRHCHWTEFLKDQLGGSILKADALQTDDGAYPALRRLRTQTGSRTSDNAQCVDAACGRFESRACVESRPPIEEPHVFNPL
jgi:hypothetical protein